MPYGWVGKILRVDLTDGKITTEDTLKYAERFIGGWGIAAKIFFDEVGPEVKAFDPENLLIFMTGPLTGTLIPGSGRTELCGRSPQTHPKEVFTYSGCGGDWGPYLKYAGFDGVVIKGASDTPVYLYIEDGEAEILDAEDLWGLDTFSAQKKLEEIHGRKVKSLVIGPAGENLCRFAIILSDTGSAFGQGGFGAVMGSKNLKAIAVRGTGGVKVADPSRVLELSEYASNLIYRKEKPTTAHDGMVSGFIPGGESWKSKRQIRGVGCHACPANCRGYFRAPGLPGGSAMCFEWWCGTCTTAPVEDPKYLLKMSDATWEADILTQTLGINNLEAAMQLTWLLKCYRLGLLNEKDIGIPCPPEIYLLWDEEWVHGTAPDIHTFLDRFMRAIAYRQGFGDKLAEGTARLAESLGEEYWKVYTELYQAHGMVSHQSFSVQANLLWALDSRDPYNSAHESWFIEYFSKQMPEAVTLAYGLPKEAADPNDYTHAPKLVVCVQDTQAIKNSLTLCDWLYPTGIAIIGYPLKSIDMDLPAKLLSAVTGKEFSREDLETVAARIRHVLRAIQVIEGRTRKDDTVYPEKFEAPFSGMPPWKIMFGPLDKAKFEEAKDKYYELRGWDKRTGWPTRETLEKYDLKDVVEKLEKLGKLPD